MPQETHLEHLHSHFSLFIEPLERLLDGPLTSLGLGPQWIEAIPHALGDFLDITLLLLVVVCIVCYIQTFIPYEKMKQRLSGIKGFLGYGLALLLGVSSPFCSCSIIPLIMGFLAAGVPLTYCLVFLSAASCLNLTALTAVFAGFPLPFALVYLLCGLIICPLGAHLTASFGADKLVRMDKLTVMHDHHHHEEKTMGRLRTALCGAGNVYKNVWPFILIGVCLSAAVTAFVSEDLMNRLLIGNPFALPLATIIGGALHSDVFSIMPIIQMVFAHSFPVALSFLLATMLFSVAEWALLSQVFRARLIAKYCGILLGFALLCGLIATFILGA